MQRFLRLGTIFLIIFLLALFWRTASKIGADQASGSVLKYSYSDLLRDLESRRVDVIEIQKDSDTSNAGTAYVKLKNGGDSPARAVQLGDMEGFQRYVDAALLADPTMNVVLLLPSKVNSALSLWIPIGVTLLLGVAIMVFFFQNMQGGGIGGRMMNFGKSRAKLNADDPNKKKVTFDDVAGLEEEKADLSEIVEFLKEPKKFADIGARIPKGVLLLGPPGTGKTYISRAVAGEAGVPFFSISGSDFVEMYVGVGASRVRDLFEQAKHQAPCIVFIDEIDAVGRRRGAGLGGGHDEREQTLNQLLVEMDGFGLNEGVIVLAATNRPDILDPALRRPGRFDRQVVVGKPDVKGREAVLRIHARNKKMAEDVDLKVIAQTTSGFTPADLENLLNEAALLAARENKTAIGHDDIKKAFVKVGVGVEKKSRVISDKDKRITAYHEAGHAVIFEVLPELDPVHIISIIPTGLAGGYTMPLPAEDVTHLAKKRMEQEIVALLGGRAAEKIVLDDITTGASNDIERATAMARDMVTKYGMSEKLGPILFGNDSDEVFIGRDLAHARNYGEGIASLIDGEMGRIINGAYRQAVNILRAHREILDKAVDLLIEKEKITGDEFRALFDSFTPTNIDGEDVLDEAVVL